LIDVIEHIKIVELKKIIQNIKILLKDHGKVFIITPNYHSLWILIENFSDKLNLLPKMAGEQHISKFTKYSLLDLFDNDFKLENIFSFNLISFLIPIRSISSEVCRFEMSKKILPGNLIASLFSYEPND